MGRAGRALFPASARYAQKLVTRDQAAVFGRPDDHQNALFFLSHPRLEGDAIGPDVEKPPRAKVALLPSLVVVPPVGLQGAEIWHLPVQTDQLQQALHKTRGLAQRHAEQHLHGDTGLNGGIAIGLLAAALTGGRSVPL